MEIHVEAIAAEAFQNSHSEDVIYVTHFLISEGWHTKPR